MTNQQEITGKIVFNEVSIINRDLTDKRLMSMALDARREKIFGTIGTENSNEFIKIENGVTTSLPNRPDGVTEDSVLHYIGNGKLLSFGVNEDTVAYIFNIKSNTWSLISDIPEEFKGLTLESVTRRDGNILFINVGEGTRNFLLFNVYENNFNIIENKVTNYSTDIIIRLKAGFILFLPTNSDASKSYIFK